MPTTTPARIALVLGIGAAALLARPALPPWVVLLAIGFGAFNVFADLPGTGRLRAIAVAGTVVALMLPSWLSALLAVIGWLI